MNNDNLIGQSHSQDGVNGRAQHTTPIQQHQQQTYNNSLAIRQEIQRFESVHPSIYAIYDLLEMIADPLLAQQCREHVVCIEDSFVNSQEWTLSRTVPDLRLGIIGSITSGKSALVHRYLTGSYMQDESPEGGRFKKEIIIDGQSYLLLIRDESGPPELQFSCWVDAVIFVFSLESEESFNLTYNYYMKMFQYRNPNDVPIILVGTQEAITESNPRVIDETKARKLANELKRCSYYETCSTYGLNVEKVFQDACQKIVQSRLTTGTNSRPNTPSSFGYYRSQYLNNISQPSTSSQPSSSTSATTSKININTSNNNSINTNNLIKSQSVNTSPIHVTNNQIVKHHQSASLSSSLTTSTKSSSVLSNNILTRDKYNTGGHLPPIRNESKSITNNNNNNNNTSSSNKSSVYSFLNDQFTSLSPNPYRQSLQSSKETKELPTPSSTPTTARKTRRRSNLFQPLSNKKHNDDKYKNGEVGSGRSIPIKQGYLYKKSIKTLNKDWKKKYVALTTDGRLTYYPTLHDYMEDVHGKAIPLKHTTVKIPGQKPRGSRTFQQTSVSPNYNCDISSDLNHLSINNSNSQEPDQRLVPSTNPKIDVVHSKKRHRRKNSNKNDDDSDGNEFLIVSLENKQWHFEANNVEERDNWVGAIEQQILTSLQSLESEKSKYKTNCCADSATIQAIRTVSGNTHCIDCDYPNPDWASLNLGALICIECSGIHRNLGTHISKVRSLDLDDWPAGHISVMMGLGNTAANSIWEYNVKGRVKPTPNSSREEKERWIRAKYNQKEFLAPIQDSISIEQLIIEAVMKSDVKQMALIIAHMTSNEQLNLNFYTHNGKTPLHISAAVGCLAIVQFFIWNNANPNAVDADGKTALYYARTAGHKQIEELLIQNGCCHVNGINSLSSKSTHIIEKLPSTII